jgi:hypothetical protein
VLEPVADEVVELVVDLDEGKIQCRLCGGWYASLAPRHLPRKHGMTGEGYRQHFGYRPSQPLQAPQLSENQRRVMRRRVRDDPTIKRGMQQGAAMARTGELQVRAKEVGVERGLSPQRLAELRRVGAALGRRRGDRYRRAREQRARALGFASLNEYLRVRYQEQERLLEELQAELGCSYSALRGDLDAAGITPRRGRRPQR